MKGHGARRKFLSVEEVNKRERRVKLLEKAILNNGGPRRFAQVSAFGINRINDWMAGIHPIKDEYIGAIEKFAEGA